MITRLHIQNYRSCLDAAFDLHPNLSVLIGPNGSGKTNILNAILLLKRLFLEEDRYYQHSEELLTGQSMLKVWFQVEKKKVIFTSKIQTFSDENNDDVIVSSDQQWYLKDFTGSAKRIKIPIGFIKYVFREIHSRGNVVRMGGLTHFFPVSRDFKRIPDAAKKPFEAIAQFVQGLRYYSASQFTNPANCPVSFEVEKEGRRRRGLRLSGHAKFLFDLYTEFKSDSDGYGQFLGIVGPDGIGLFDRINFKEILTSSIDYSVRSGGRVQQRKRDKILVIPQFVIGKHELSPNQLSEGTFKTITLLFYLVTEASDILLIEEPEVCVHHGLLSSIVELIKIHSREKQIVISTHSDFVLDKVSPENVYKISSTRDFGTKVTHVPKAMSKQELDALRAYLKKEGNLGEYWKHGALE